MTLQATACRIFYGGYDLGSRFIWVLKLFSRVQSQAFSGRMALSRTGGLDSA